MATVQALSLEDSGPGAAAKERVTNHSVVRFKVSGETFDVLLTSLKNVVAEDSLIWISATAHHFHQVDTDGTPVILLARDSSIFRIIYGYINTGRFKVPSDETLADLLLHEAEYYGITEIVSRLRGAQKPIINSHIIPVAAPERDVKEVNPEKDFLQPSIKIDNMGVRANSLHIPGADSVRPEDVKIREDETAARIIFGRDEDGSHMCKNIVYTESGPEFDFEHKPELVYSAAGAWGVGNQAAPLVDSFKEFEDNLDSLTMGLSRILFDKTNNLTLDNEQGRPPLVFAGGILLAALHRWPRFKVPKIIQRMYHMAECKLGADIMPSYLFSREYVYGVPQEVPLRGNTVYPTSDIGRNMFRQHQLCQHYYRSYIQRCGPDEPEAQPNRNGLPELPRDLGAGLPDHLADVVQRALAAGDARRIVAQHTYVEDTVQSFLTGNNATPQIADNLRSEGDIGAVLSLVDRLRTIKPTGAVSAPIEKRPVTDSTPDEKQPGSASDEKKPVTDSAPDEKQPVTDSAPDEKQPVTDSAPDEKQPVTDSAPDEKRPVTDSAPDEKRPVTDSMPDEKQPVTDSAPDEKQPITNPVPDEKKPITDSAPDEKQVVTDSAPDEKQVVTDSAPDEKQVVTDSAPDEKQPVTDSMSDGKQPVTNSTSDANYPDEKQPVTNPALDEKHPIEISSNNDATNGLGSSERSVGMQRTAGELKIMVASIVPDTKAAGEAETALAKKVGTLAYMARSGWSRQRPQIHFLYELDPAEREIADYDGDAKERVIQEAVLYHFVNTDIDLFLTTTDPNIALKTIIDVYRRLRAHVPLKCAIDIMRTDNAVTFIMPKPYRNVQIITRLYLNAAHVTLGFDIDCCAMSFDGKALALMPRAKRALMLRQNLVDTSRQSTTFEYRLTKYARRGFSVAMPGYDIKAALHTAASRLLVMNINLEQIQNIRGAQRLITFLVLDQNRKESAHLSVSSYQRLNIPTSDYAEGTHLKWWALSRTVEEAGFQGIELPFVLGTHIEEVLYGNVTHYAQFSCHSSLPKIITFRRKLPHAQDRVDNVFHGSFNPVEGDWY